MLEVVPGEGALELDEDGVHLLRVVAEGIVGLLHVRAEARHAGRRLAGRRLGSLLGDQQGERQGLHPPTLA
jgi:hypothetical protein